MRTYLILFPDGSTRLVNHFSLEQALAYAKDRYEMIPVSGRLYLCRL